MAKKSFVLGTVILMAAGLAVRMLGFVYRIFLSNLIGAEGMGLFQLIVPVYSLIVMTLTSGISIAVSKMVAEEVAGKNYKNVGRVTYVAFVTVTIAGLAISVLLWVFATDISVFILKDSRTYLSLLVLVPCIPAVAAAAALKGYYYGVQHMGPTAVSAVCEQLIKMVIVMFFIGGFIDRGVEYACAMAIFGSAVGEITNMLVLLIYYKLRKNMFPKQEFQRSPATRKRIILKELVKVSIPVSFNRLTLSLMGAVEMIMIPQRLLAGGLDYTMVMEEYGKLMGMVMPLVFFPSVITSSLATSLVPAVSEAISLKNYRTANYRISKSIQYTMIAGFIFTVVFLTYPHEIGKLIYRSVDIGDMLYLLSFTCIFVYLSQTLLGILNGLGKQGAALRNSVIGSALRIGCVYFIIPLYGVTGYVYASIISAAITIVLNMGSVVKVSGMTVEIRRWILRPGLVSVLMYIFGKYFYYFYSKIGIPHSLNVLISVGSLILSTIILMVMAGALDKQDVTRFLPKGLRTKRFRRKYSG